ncbi:FixH family protein [Rubellimicrobium mesophilum DSM 19309]|uniref:FixH family protein n=1 Tax=Rubellimicrobium mesophilum DSM 19309 TaxID=442562 RepID=A0A017HMT1_9RHOB|nr:FixH family protein [Rubellimicrobium mesophilum]EYD75681.1 FixH family protein [Rubellimicrobium mesophilum DSM 19309]
MTSLFRGPITGPKAFAIFSSFFLVIIAVNVVMAYQAVHTFPGLEVENSYVASQTFDAEKQAQEALGWTAHATVADGKLVLRVTGADGRPVQGATMNAVLGRTTEETEDQVLAFAFDGEAWRAPAKVERGHWELRIDAVAVDGTPFRQRLDLNVE